jgi:hypothetical protein
MTDRSIQNFWSHVNKLGQIRVEHLGHCWEWTASKFDMGYGQFKGGPSTRAHRVAWELVKGPCPLGLEAEHLCNYAGCVNPDHIDWVTHGVNLSQMGNRKQYGLIPALTKRVHQDERAGIEGGITNG